MKDIFFSWHYIVWAPVIVLCFLVLLYRNYKTIIAVRLLTGIQGKLFFSGYNQGKLFIKALFFSLALGLFFIALLRPQWNEKKIEVKQEGRELFIALDVSRSMLATDCAPTRLDCAKKKIMDLLNSLSCERVGLILFSGSAFVQCPLTADYDAFYMFLSQVDAETISSGTTALAEALSVAIKSFEHVSNGANKIVVLFTDGEDFSQNLSEIKQQAANQNISLFAMGVGTPSGAPVPLFDYYGKQIGHQKDRHGKVVISRLNEQMLQSLTADLDGVYIPMQNDSQDIMQLVQWVESFEKATFEDNTIIIKEDTYHYFIGAGLLCLFLEWFL